MVFVKIEPREILQFKWEQVAGTCRKITECGTLPDILMAIV